MGRWSPQIGPQLDAITARWCEELFYGGAAGGGKGLNINELVPTPAGFTAMGDLRVGDLVFDQDGEPCRVTIVSDVNHRPCYEVEFDDGTVIVADDVHRWLTLTSKERMQITRLDSEWRERRRARRPSRAVEESQKPWVSSSITLINRTREQVYLAPPVPQIRDTAEIAASVHVGKAGRLNHSVAVPQAISCATLALPIEPYLLGLWLGDGYTRSGSIGMMADDWREILPHIDRLPRSARDGLPKNASRRRPFTLIRFAGLQRDLRLMGLLGNKHIPSLYQRASIEQRRELLRGLLDTDGHCDARGRIELGLSNERLARDAQELICGLGHKAALSVKRLSAKSDAWNDSYRLQCHLDFPAFKLPRKLGRQKPSTRDTARARYITAVRPIPSVPTRCIAVDSPSRTYLVGRTFVPTHNTDFLLADYLQDVEHFGAAWQGILFRRSMPELEEIMSRAQEMYPSTGAVWREQNKRWTWPNGAKLRLRYLEADRDATRYQGGAYTWIGWDELGQHPTPFGYKYLRGRLRSAHPVSRKRIRSSANPGGVGHHWLKAKFVSPAPLGGVLLQDPDTGGDVMFIRAKLSDNKILMQNDPLYARRLQGMGSEALVRAWLDGDWDIIAGAFFPEFTVEKHVVRAHSLPADWPRFRSGDWGSYRPFAFHWWAISDGSDARYPRGAIINYREWYGWNGNPNEGLKMTAEAVGTGIAEREAGEKVNNGASVLDPSAFSSDGGPSIAERLRLGSGNKVDFRRADNKRVAKVGAIGGWDQVRSRLIGEDERPMIYFFDTCTEIIRTLPVLQHDELKPEDVDTDGEDHAPDSVRYACMSRPYLRRDLPKKDPVFPGVSIGVRPPPNVRVPTFDEMWKDHERENRR